MRIRTVEDSFEYQAKQMIERFKEYLYEEDKDRDLTDLIWEKKELFGQIAYEVIGDYCGYEWIDNGGEDDED